MKFVMIMGKTASDEYNDKCGRDEHDDALLYKTIKKSVERQ